MKPNYHSLWSSLAFIVAIVDFIGVRLLFYAPAGLSNLVTGGMSVASIGLFLMLGGSVGPILALAGGVVGLVWKPPVTRSSKQTLSR